MKKKTIRVAGLLCLVCVVAGGIVGYRMYNKPHRSAASETAVELTAQRLAADYEKDEAVANKKYLDKAVQVSGTVSEISFNQQNKPVIVLMGANMSGVQCTLQEDAKSVRKGDSITIKGFCTGYLTDVILDRCILDSK